MLELKFVLKSFAIAMVIMIALQFKVGQSTLEDQAQYWIHTSAIPVYLQKVSSGAVLAIRNASGAVSDFVSKNIGSDSTTQKASKWNLDFKRAQKVREENAERD